MLQLQYLNSKLKNHHISHILNNYKLKYTAIKNEIESKVNEMIKIILGDILDFLENIEDKVIEKKKLSNYDKMKNELETMKNQLKEKINNETKAKNDIDALNHENLLLKDKINSLNKKISNMRNGTKEISNKFMMTPKINLRSSFTNINSKNISHFSQKVNKSVNLSMKSENNSMENNLNEIMNKNGRNNSQKNNNLQNDKYNIRLQKTQEVKQKKVKTINLKKFVNNKIDKGDKTAHNLGIKNNLDNSKINSRGPILASISNIIINNTKKEKKNKNRISNSSKISNDNSIDNSDDINQEHELLAKNINDAFDDELKQLELDEKNVQNLVEKINRILK